MCCNHCGNVGLEIVEANELGLASELHLKYKSCTNIISRCPTSHRTVTAANAPFEVTTHIVTAMIDIGVGFAVLEKFTTVMGMNSVHHMTFNKYAKTVNKAMKEVADSSLKMVAEIVRET